MAAFIELLEQTEAHTLLGPRRLYVNVESIAFVSAHGEAGPAVLTFHNPGHPVIVVSETWQQVQDLIDQALTTRNTSPYRPPPPIQGGENILRQAFPEQDHDV